MGEQANKKTGMRPGLRWLLICSLGLNLVVAGLAGGAILGAKRMENRPHRDIDLVAAYTRALDGKDRREIGRSLRDHYRGKGSKIGARQTSFDAMLEALKASPFEIEAVRKILDKQAGAAVERRSFVQAVWLERIEAMSEAERSAYADRIVDELAKRRPPGRKERD